MDVINDGHLDFIFHYSTWKLSLSNADGAYTEDSSGIPSYTSNSCKFGSAWGELLKNQTNDANYLMVRAIDPDSGGTNRGVIGVRVELFDARGATLLAPREIGVARGYGGGELVWAHFGGVDPVVTYIVRITWPGGSQMTSSVVPQNASTTIGAQTVSQMLTIKQTLGIRVVNWRAVSPID